MRVVSLTWLVLSGLATVAAAQAIVRLPVTALQRVFGIWPLTALWSAIPALALMRSGQALIRGDWRAAAGWSSIPATAAAIFLYGNLVGDTLRFRLEQNRYDRVIADIRSGRCGHERRTNWPQIADFECDRPVVTVFEWARFLSSWYGVVYDEADEIARAPGDRHSSWAGRDTGKLLGCSLALRSFGGHYYFASGEYSPDGECG